MMAYKFLGALSILLLVLGVGLAVYALRGELPRKRTYLISGIVLFLFLVLSTFCSIIFIEYHP